MMIQHVVDMTQVYVTGIEIVGAVVTAPLVALAWGCAKKVAAWMHVDLDAKQQQMITDVVDRGIAKVQAEATDAAKANGKLAVSDANVAHVLQYVADNRADLMKKLGATQDVAGALGQRVAAQIAQKLA